jgi:cobalt-zinc-cadmium efflux system membrane fusion protein
VQSTISGRYEAPPGGVPPLGARVKAGDLLGQVTPAFASIDSSDMAQTLGDIEQKLSIARAKLARQEQLLRSNVVASALVDETRMEVDGLIKRRTDLLAARVRAEELRAPVDGVIAASRAVSGQVVSPSDKLLEIIDPSRVLIEALVFDQIDPDTVREASAAVSGNSTLELRLLGRSRALQQQYVLMQFEVVGTAGPLSIGLPVTVIARAGVPVSGIFVPRAALAQAPNGQTVVFEHKEPEVFVPRAVRTEPFDNETVLVTGGLEAGTKIVVRNAPLVNQVR